MIWSLSVRHILMSSRLLFWILSASLREARLYAPWAENNQSTVKASGNRLGFAWKHKEHVKGSSVTF